MTVPFWPRILGRHQGDWKRHKCLDEMSEPSKEQRDCLRCQTCERWFKSPGGLSVHRKKLHNRGIGRNCMAVDNIWTCSVQTRSATWPNCEVGRQNRTNMCSCTFVVSSIQPLTIVFHTVYWKGMNSSIMLKLHAQKLSVIALSMALWYLQIRVVPTLYTLMTSSWYVRLSSTQRIRQRTAPC